MVKLSDVISPQVQIEPLQPQLGVLEEGGFIQTLTYDRSHYSELQSIKALPTLPIPLQCIPTH